VLKGLRNGLEYGSRVRFVHSLVMTFLFKTFNSKTVKAIFKNAWDHGKRLGTFVFFYKSVCLILSKLLGDRPFNSFAAGFVVGGLVFGKKTPINYQINLYLLSRIAIALVEFLYKKYLPERLAGQQDESFERKYGFRILAAVVWGVVMWLFYIDQKVLQESLAASMRHLYINSEKPIKSWQEFIPYSSHK
jgi:peroxisomal membrane protein 4